MINRLTMLVAAVLCLNLVSANAQMGGGAPKGPQLSGSMAKLFGKNSAFSATMEMQSKSKGQDIVMPGKLAFDSGKSRFEMDMSEAKGPSMRPEAMGQMKSMGMDKMVMIARPDKKVHYMIYPGMKAYAEVAIKDPDSSKSEADYKLETTKLGEEKVDGHPCIKNKAVVTDSEGKKHESTIWTATDLKGFPVKIETAEHGQAMTMLFKDVKLAKPDASLFETPADLTRYDSPMALMQGEMMKRMGGGMALPPGMKRPNQ